MESPAMAATPVMQGLARFNHQDNTVQQPQHHKSQNMAQQLAAAAAANQPSGLPSGASDPSLNSSRSQPRDRGGSTVFRFDDGEPQSNQHNQHMTASTPATVPNTSSHPSVPTPASAPIYHTQAQQNRRQRAPRPSASDISHLLSCMVSANNAPPTQSTNALLSPSEAFVPPVDTSVFDMQPSFPGVSNELSQGAPASPGLGALIGAANNNNVQAQQQQWQKPATQQPVQNAGIAHFEQFFAGLPQDATDETVATLNPGTKEEGPLSCDFHLGNIPSIDDAVLHINTLELPALQDYPAAPGDPTTTAESGTEHKNPWTSAVPQMLGAPAQDQASPLTQQQQSMGQGGNARATGTGEPPASSPATSCASFNSSVFTETCPQASPSDSAVSNGAKNLRQRRGRRSRQSTKAAKASRRVSEMKPDRVHHVRKLARLAARRRRHQARVKDRMREHMCDELLERNKSLSSEREQLLIKLHALVQVAAEKFPHLLPQRQQ